MNGAAWVLLGAVVVAAVGALAAPPVVRALRRDHPDLVGPVVVYMVVISAMLTLALAGGPLFAAAGAAAFYASDLAIARTRFVRPHAWGPVAIMVLYHLGQAALVVSLTSRP